MNRMRAIRFAPLALAGCAALGIVCQARAWPAVNALAGSRIEAYPAESASVSESLSRKFSSPDISYLLLDLRTNTLVASRWSSSEHPIPVGSLVKPFTALAYAEANGFVFPEHYCAAGTCWLPGGHGRLGIVRAVALSCNSYFTSLAGKVAAPQVREVAHRFGLAGPPANASAAALAGREGVWRESPRALLHAYAELLGRRGQPGAVEILAGMRASAREGTAAEIARAVPLVPAFAKTGTAPCTHVSRAPGDGFVIAAWPADSPRYLLLLRQHGRPGAVAASAVGQMVKTLEVQR